ncbi:hypothetical protein SFRURICE_013135 [Spodoptera frugiperda]|nr:hypothetical protein SFRURICE_013135 [Spodoptera frugiperda]
MFNGIETYTAARKYLYNMTRKSGGRRGRVDDVYRHERMDNVMHGGHRADVSKYSRSSKFTRSEVHRNMKDDILCERKTPKTASPSDLASTSGPTKLLVSSLDYEASSLDIQELFEEYGVIQRAAISSERAIRSKVTAEVVFEMRADALKALKELQGRNFDGKPLKIEISTSELLTHEERSAFSGDSDYNGSSGSDGRNARRSDAKRKKDRRVSRNSDRERAAAEDAKRSAFTAEQLDAELDAYMASVKEAKRRKTQMYTAARYNNSTRKSGGSRGRAGGSYRHDRTERVLRGGHRGDISKPPRPSNYPMSEVHRVAKDGTHVTRFERKSQKNASVMKKAVHDMLVLTHTSMDSVMRGEHRADVSTYSRSLKFTRSEVHRNMKEDILCERKTHKTASLSDLASTTD